MAPAQPPTNIAVDPLSKKPDSAVEFEVKVSDAVWNASKGVRAELIVWPPPLRSKVSVLCNVDLLALHRQRTRRLRPEGSVASRQPPPQRRRRAQRTLAARSWSVRGERMS